MIRLVYFDFGGVLTEIGKKGFVAAMLAELYGVPPEHLDISDIHELLRRGQANDQIIFDYLNARYHKRVTKEQFIARAHKELTASHEVYALAQALRQAGIRTGILSNVFAMSADVLRKEGLYDGFEPLILSCDTGFAKPDRELYELAIEQAGVAADEILFVEDQDKCLPPARALGMHTVQATSPSQIVADVQAVIREQNRIDLVL